MFQERIEKYFLAHPHQRLIFGVILVLTMTGFCLYLVSRSIELSFGAERVNGVVVRHNTGLKSSSYDYEYKVAGRIHSGKLLQLVPFVFSFKIGQHVQVVFNSRKPDVSTLEVAIVQEYIICLGMAVLVIAIWISWWKLAVDTAIGEKVDSIDLRLQVKEFEEERQHKLSNKGYSEKDL